MDAAHPVLHSHAPHGNEGAGEWERGCCGAGNEGVGDGNEGVGDGNEGAG